MAEPDLADLDAFAAVARARGFRGAAARRGVSPSSLSQAVRRLEERLGVRLLNRTTRSVTATEAGERLLNRLTPTLAELAQALDEVNSFRDSPTGTLRLNMPTVAAKLVMPGLIGPFLREHPGITLEITAEDSFIDVLAAGFDAGVRYEERLEQDMIAVPMGPDQRYVLCAAPDYVARHGAPAHPREVLHHSCIRHRFLSGVALPWEFEKAGEIIRVSPRGPLVGNVPEIGIRAAEEGLGLLLTFDGLVAPAIAAGRLVEVMVDWSTPFTGPRLYYAGRRQMPAPLRAFVDFLHARRAAGWG
jgi:DNA-binding transcriptional LysR family regulator